MRKKLLSVSDFARFSRTTKATLLHYDRIGLLTPASRGNNNRFRYYSTRQLGAVNLIRTLQEFGMQLDEIKNMQDKRTPGDTARLFTRLMMSIDERIMQWHRSKQLLFTLLRTILMVSDVDEEAISIEELPAEPLVMGGQNDYSGGRNEYDALFDFYKSLSDRRMDMNYPVWGIFSKERIRARDWKWPDRYYFYNPEGFDARPAGLYATGYARGGYGQTEGLCGRLLDYIENNGYEICGDAYEEYPLNEISVSDDQNFLIRVMMNVRKI